MANKLLGLLFVATVAEDVIDDGMMLLQFAAHKGSPKSNYLPSSGIPDSVINLMSKAPAQSPHDSKLTVEHKEYSSMGTCQLLQAEDCHTVCHWLKLTEKDESSGQCPLFEWSLKTCGYKDPEKRGNGEEDPLDSLDCAVTLLRTPVKEDGMMKKIDELTDCLHNLPSAVNTSCHVAVDLARAEIRDWRKEARLLANVTEMRTQLAAVCVAGEAALADKTGEVEAVVELAKTLEKAERIPGSYLSEEIHTARRLLENLAPIPAVKDALSEAIEFGNSAFASKSLALAKEAQTTVAAASQAAVDFGLDTSKADKLLQQLRSLERDLIAFKSARFKANVSLATQQNMPKAMRDLARAAKQVEKEDITDGVKPALSLVETLNKTQLALVDLKQATADCEKLLEPKSVKGLVIMEAMRKSFSQVIQTAQSLNITGNAKEEAALECQAKLEYTYQARMAIHDTITNGQEVIDNNGGNLSDDAEEVSIAALIPAMKWAKEVNILSRIKPAQKLAVLLQSVEDAKEQMTEALGSAQESVDARSGEVSAAKELEAAITADHKVDISAGLDKAKEMLKLLRQRDSAKEQMAKAHALAREALSKNGLESRKAEEALNASIQESHKVGLTEEEALGIVQLHNLQNAVSARQNLSKVLKAAMPARRVNETKANDTVPTVVFNRTGYEVKDLPAVPLGDDDGDDDFQEHIDAIRKAIDEGKADGFVDSDMEVQLAFERNLAAAYGGLLASFTHGRASFESKDDTEDAIVDLVEALKVGADAELVLGMKDTRALLSKLRRIQPAIDELEEAIEEANVSLTTYSHMGNAQIRLNTALDDCSQLNITERVPQGTKLRDRLIAVKAAYVQLKAAIVQAQISLDREEGEEAAITELDTAVKLAKEIGLYRDLPVAIDLLMELVKMNGVHSKVELGMQPAQK